jgi:Na+/phosphate symporter
LVEALVNKYLCNVDEQPLNAFEQEREAQIAKNHRKMEELGEVVEGFGDINETYSDLQDELMTLAIEVLVLPCIEFRWEG